jgi:biotin operon repressor
MQITEVRPVSTNVEVIGPSLVMDLSWCLTNCQKSQMTRPIPQQMSRELIGYQGRVESFWDDDMRGFAEVEVLANIADAVALSEFTTFRGRCEEALRTQNLDLDLMSETPEDKARILARLRKLRDSAELRVEYFDLLSEVWSVVAPWWEEEGVRAIGRAISEVESKLSNGSRWYEIMDSECDAFQENIAGIIGRYENGKPVKLVPCAFFGSGLYFEFPEFVIFGFGIASAVEEAKTRVSSMVGPLRALAEPTRLAIVEILKTGPATIKDIAETFSLSQPTISVHVKRLREAGLVIATRNGNQLEISINKKEGDKFCDTFTAFMSR